MDCRIDPDIIIITIFRFHCVLPWLLTMVQFSLLVLMDCRIDTRIIIMIIFRFYQLTLVQFYL